MDLQVYWSVAMIKSDESLLVMSSSLIASILDWYIANYFTYHFLLASYFGRHFVAPENSIVTCFPFRNTSLRFLWQLFPSLGRLTLFPSYDKPSMVLCPVEKKALAPISLLVVGTNSASPSWLKSIGALSPESKCVDQPKTWKKEYSISLLTKDSMELVPTHLGEVAFAFLTCWDHFISIS